MSFVALTNAETDAKSPMDDFLWGKVRDDLNDLDSRVVLAGASPFAYELQGHLSYISTHKRSICMGVVAEAFTPSRCRYMLKRSGTSGTLAFDIRKHTAPRTPITAISHQYTAATQSIAQAAGLSTQSIARATAQISTQSITFAKPAQNIQSIVSLGTINGIASLFQINLVTAIDADTVVGDSITFAGCTNSGNNGTKTILEINRGGFPSVVVSNGSGAAQTNAVGTAQLQIMSYNFTNPVGALFAAGYSHKFASHSSGVNDGTLAVYAINQAGNNVWVKHSTGIVQGGVAGSLDTNFWTFAFGSAVTTTDYIVGEAAKTSGHTSGNNDGGAFPIIAVNSGGNNLILYNTAGVAQGGAAGTTKTNRWIYAMPTDPGAQVSVGYNMYLHGHTNALNDGQFAVVEVNRAASNGFTIYNTAGVAQGGTTGTAYTCRKLIQFAADQSASYNTSSYIEMDNCADILYNHNWAYSPLQVLEVNRGGGSNYNVVVELSGVRVAASAQTNPAGYVEVEMKSIFNTPPSLAYDITGNNPNQNLVGTSTDLIATVVASNTPLMLYLTSVMGGDPKDLTITIR